MPPSYAERNFLLVEGELLQERASALGRAGRKLEEQFERCLRLGRLLDERTDVSGSHELLREYRQARDDFEQVRWRLCVQREAIGLFDHKWIARVFPRPSRR
jgi:hypothetical protein